MYRMVKVIELFGGSNISAGSKKTYTSKLKKLNGDKTPTDLLFLKDTKTVLEQIEKISKVDQKTGKTSDEILEYMRINMVGLLG